MSIELSKKDNTNDAKGNGSSSKDDFAELRDREFVSQINQMRKLDNWTNWRYLAVEYSYLATVMGLGFLLSVLWVQAIISIWLYVPVLLAISVLIGIGQHRLVMLGHEASHFALFRNKALNETVSDWFCFYPIWVTTYNYRIQHMAHHQHTNDPEKDPDFAYMSVCGHHYTPPMERNDFLWRCILGPAMAIPNQLRFLYIRLKLALLTGVLRKFRRRGSWASRLILVSFLVTYLSSLGYVYFGGHLAMLWPMTAIVLTVASVFACIARTNSLIEGTFKPYVNPKIALIGRMAYIALLFSVLVHLRLATGLPFVMAYYALWVLPLATTFSFLMILREDIQHSHTEEGRFRNTRDAEVPWLMKWAVFPYGMDLHLAHHLFSMVPHYRLPELDKLLQSKTPYQEQREIFGEELFHAGHSHTA